MREQYAPGLADIDAGLLETVPEASLVPGSPGVDQCRNVVVDEPTDRIRRTSPTSRG
jgi:hypothetical protein